MRNMLKKLMTIFTAGVLTATAAASLAACGGNFTPPTGLPSGNASSNGGFAVEVGNYYYFINGVQTYDSDNTYGTPVKGALMRIAKNSLKENKAETVIPSLMTAGDYSSGIYIYDGRVYYATPNNIQNTSGEIERDYLDFKSAKLDGTDIQSYFNVSSNSTPYRFVQTGGTVYLVYTQSNSIYSYNTKTKEKTTLAENVGKSFFSSTDKEDPYVYYTMSVTLDIDVPSGSLQRSYNQVYRVRADATECPYTELRDYEWNEEYLDENDGKVPYVNYGELVLDGIGSIYKENPTIFSHDTENATFHTTAGFTYDLQSYANGGIYFTRKDITTTGTVGEDGWLYFLSADKLSSGWNSISGNEKSNLDVVAQPSDLSYANSSALFYIENGTHHYLYVNGSSLLRADLDKTGKATVTRIAQGVSNATIVSIDEENHYVYFTQSGGSGNNIWRAVYNGDAENYKSLGYDANELFLPVQVLNIQHAKSWYNFEIIDGLLFYADAESIGSTSYNYIAYVDLCNADGSLMNNKELKEYKEKMDEIIGKDGYLAELESDGKTTLSTALKYNYYTGETSLFYDNIKEALKETEQENTLYSPDEVEEFEEYVKKTHDLRSDYIHEIGIKTETDSQSIETYWQLTLEHYVAPAADESTGMPVWAWIIIALGIILVLGAIAVTIILVLRSNRESDEFEEEKMFVDTTDDKSVDVYSDEPVTAPEIEAEESAEEQAEEAEEESEEASEAPSEELETPAEASDEAEAPAEPSEESETPEA